MQVSAPWNCTSPSTTGRSTFPAAISALGPLIVESGDRHLVVDADAGEVDEILLEVAALGQAGEERVEELGVHPVWLPGVEEGAEQPGDVHLGTPLAAQRVLDDAQQ